MNVVAQLFLSVIVVALIVNASPTNNIARETRDEPFRSFQKAEEDIPRITSTTLQKKLALASASTSVPSPHLLNRRRRHYPESNPHVCLAFLSCCNRIDLLNHTLAAAIRHLEEDEPTYSNSSSSSSSSSSFLRYEIAWVDNGSQPDLVQSILESYQIEHALPLEQNMGLAIGMNLLMFQLCTAPYILLLEEDWLYLDDIVVDQTKRRRHAIATSIALLEQEEMMAYDGRKVMGVFLRPETYSSFLQFPYADVWNTTLLNMHQLTVSSSSSNSSNRQEDASCDEPQAKQQQPQPLELELVDYRIFCADSGLKSGSIWGSFTNGAGLYRRSDLRKIGRMYGEPGDAFHDAYVESNYAFRAGLQACHAAIRLSDDRTCQDVGQRNCTAAFYHIGGGRGTRPQSSTGTKCAHFAWNFYDTPMYDKFVKYQSQIGNPVPDCTPAELEELRQLRFKQAQIDQYRSQVEEENKVLFEKERAKRDEVRKQAQLILSTDKDLLRSQVAWMAGMTDEEIEKEARLLIRLADSPHPLQGFWDSHGRPVAKNYKTDTN